MDTANDNSEVVNTSIKYYFFGYSFTNEGILTTLMDEQETRDKLNRELATIYGPEGVTVTEFREATDTEVEEYKQALAARFGDIVSTTPTVN